MVLMLCSCCAAGASGAGIQGDQGGQGRQIDELQVGALLLSIPPSQCFSFLHCAGPHEEAATVSQAADVALYLNLAP